MTNCGSGVKPVYCSRCDLQHQPPISSQDLCILSGSRWDWEPCGATMECQEARGLGTPAAPMRLRDQEWGQQLLSIRHHAGHFTHIISCKSERSSMMQTLLSSRRKWGEHKIFGWLDTYFFFQVRHSTSRMFCRYYLLLLFSVLCLWASWMEFLFSHYCYFQAFLVQRHNHHQWPHSHHSERQHLKPLVVRFSCQGFNVSFCWILFSFALGRLGVLVLRFFPTLGTHV